MEKFFDEITNKAKDIYGEELPRQVKERLEFEFSCFSKFDSWIQLYYARKLTEQALNDRQIYGTRKTIGSLLSAFLLGIAEANPLKAHYYCENCKHSEFEGYENYYTCFDLKDRACPNCGAEMKKSGFNIPAESAVGYDGSKYPSVELTFSKDYIKEIAIPDSTEELYIEAVESINITKLQRLSELTGVDVKDIPFNDLDVLKLFIDNATDGIAEFETEFFRQVIDIVNPDSLSNFIKIIGLCFGTNVWNDNGHFLIENYIATIDQIPALREDVFEYLLGSGITRREAFYIKARTRMGKFILDESTVELFQKHNVPNWYIDSLCKIKYMFPKSHAVSKMMQAYQLAWFKLYYKKEFEKIVSKTKLEFE